MIVKIENNIPNDLIIIEYMAGNLCNYQCNYCFPGSNTGDIPWANIDLLIKNFDHLLSYYSNNNKKKFHLYLIGGETTLWKDLPKFCTYLKGKYNIVIEISTNATRKIDWWDTNSKYFDHVGVSVHNEQASIPHLIEVCDLLYEKNVNVCADVLMDPLAFDKCLSNIEELKTSRHDWPIVAKIVNYDGKTKYNEEQTKFFNEDPIKRYPNLDWYYKTSKKIMTEVSVKFSDNTEYNFKGDSWLIKENKNNFYGFKCNIGLDVIKIYPDGKITGNCNQRLFGHNDYYYLYDDDFINKFNPSFVPAICNQLICPCARETVCRKERNDS